MFSFFSVVLYYYVSHWYLNVPLGQGIAAKLPAGQYDPDGHGIPVSLSFGEGVTAPPKHKNPALQGPVGDTSPGQTNKYQLPI